MKKARVAPSSSSCGPSCSKAATPAGHLKGAAAFSAADARSVPQASLQTELIPSSLHGRLHLDCIAGTDYMLSHEVNQEQVPVQGAGWEIMLSEDGRAGCIFRLTDKGEPEMRD
eukprot:3148066-Lingulodinium_polyedra.AAC.1